MPHSQMLINYVPGDECRVAIVEDGKLEELYAERFAQASRVGNIYVGRVVNVEPSIQAAFVDFGVEENGFLHYSDLHPRYFPGEDVEETTERVGHKTPRRERPPIQQCLRRGQEITVQVLKEGVGTKGPTLTSYLSIPGRFLVMMPQMDKVGVSRKVEDEDQRRQMREILDQLELPEGFGFILRTAGLDRTKAELKRDLAYLQRLWKDMDRRLGQTGKTKLLYSESDLLVRCLRDQLTGEINEVIIDNELALQRAARFMKIVSPRSQTKLLHYPGRAPIFHAFGVEQQIATIHAREVPLPGGGRLVIDQTEALVAIDVNSGKMRDSRDAETNAFKTNLEAVDEICRQLRLRDLGGIVVNDLIDMRHASHRKEIETRFKERLKRDKSRTTTASISPFGILEMTRQRMRGSHESVHFVDCPTCRGRGLVQRPDSVAADALRELAAVLDNERIDRIEMVVAPRVAGELLSSKRKLLGRIERESGKRVDVRVSETVALDRISFYAYDPSGADIDVANLAPPRKPRDLKEWIDPEGGESDPWAEPENVEPAEEPVGEESLADHVHPLEIDDPRDRAAATVTDRAAAGPGEGQGGRKRRRRRRGRGKGEQGGPPQDGVPRAPERDGEAAAQAPVANRPPHGEAEGEAFDDGGAFEAPHGEGEPGAPGSAEGSESQGPPGEGGRRRRRRRRRGRRGRGGGQPGTVEGEMPQGGPAQPVGIDGAAEPSSGYRNDRSRPERAPAEGHPAPESGEHNEGAPGDGSGADGEGSHEDGAGGVRRKRRRRRGRRGRGGGQGEGPARTDGQAGAPEHARPRTEAPRREERPVPPPAPPATKPPKLLYGGARRKLKPSELPKGGRDE